MQLKIIAFKESPCFANRGTGNSELRFTETRGFLHCIDIKEIYSSGSLREHRARSRDF